LGKVVIQALIVAREIEKKKGTIEVGQKGGQKPRRYEKSASPWGGESFNQLMGKGLGSGCARRGKRGPRLETTFDRA